MTDPLLFAESFLSWSLANYALSPDPVHDDQTHPEVAPGNVPGWTAWLARIVLRSLLAAILVIFCGRGSRLAGIFAAAVVLACSILLPITRRLLVPVRFLAEHELLVSGLVALLLWLICRRATGCIPPFLSQAISRDHLAALCLCTALLIITIRGGTYVVRGILEKAGGIPPPAVLSSESYTHGRIIGQVERAIVFLIVIVGNLQALAFFFAAKGLIRSRELEERTRVDYLLLGSLSSFLVALSSGLLAQKVLTLLWK